MMLSALLCDVCVFDLPLIQFVTNDADRVVAVVKCGHFSFFFCPKSVMFFALLLHFE